MTEALRKNNPMIILVTPGRIAEISAAGLFLIQAQLEFPASGNGTEPSSSIETLLLHLKVDSFEKMCSCNGCALCYSIVFIIHSRQLKDVVFNLEARGMNAAELHGALSKLGWSTILKKFIKWAGESSRNE
ncbi:hypothetical protein OIU77_022990 [Salix suchowensis]|uniref:Uncharacterized protein n=1 Tax=Salix suchowensis TaxID=1278906 RepID=A0ABQ9C296_9ROSI|nr:hypothetical protein OIU77_022990 [Salix suchowensis]